MKKILFLLFGVLLLATVSCSSDDDSPKTSLVGTWQLSTMKINGTLQYNGQTIPVNETQSVTDCMKKSKMTFSSSENGSAEVWSDESGSCKLSASEEFTYAYDSDSQILTMDYGDYSESMKVQVSKTELSVYQELKNYYIEGILFNGTMTLVFKKIN